MVTLSQSGNFRKTLKRLLKLSKGIDENILHHYGQQGVDALNLATPKDTGKTAASWYYKVVVTKENYQLSFFNTNIQNGVPIALVIQYGHAMPNGTYIEGIDYINPALQPIFKDLADEVWKEVTK